MQVVGVVCYSKVVSFGIDLHCEDGHLVSGEKNKQTNKQTRGQTCDSIKAHHPPPL